MDVTKLQEEIGLMKVQVCGEGKGGVKGAYVHTFLILCPYPFIISRGVFSHHSRYTPTQHSVFAAA